MKDKRPSAQEIEHEKPVVKKADETMPGQEDRESNNNPDRKLTSIIVQNERLEQEADRIIIKKADNGIADGHPSKETKTVMTSNRDVEKASSDTEIEYDLPSKKEDGQPSSIEMVEECAISKQISKGGTQDNGLPSEQV